MWQMNDLGATVFSARESHRDPVESVLELMGGQLLFSGKITNVTRRLVGGFARGVVDIQGTGGNDGRSIAIYFQNENLIARDDSGAVLAVVPDLICIVEEETAAPITTEILRYGQRVAVLGIPAPEQLRTPNALATVGPAAFGYHDVAITPLPGMFGSGHKLVRADRV